jgi:hypothetical protein
MLERRTRIANAAKIIRNAESAFINATTTANNGCFVLCAAEMDRPCGGISVICTFGNNSASIRAA